MEKKINLTTRRGSERDPPVSRALVRDPAVGGGMEEPAGPAAGSGKARGAGQAAGGGMEVVNPAAGSGKARGAGQAAGGRIEVADPAAGRSKARGAGQAAGGGMEVADPALGGRRSSPDEEWKNVARIRNANSVQQNLVVFVGPASIHSTKPNARKGKIAAPKIWLGSS